ncbi:MAG: IclR family transcriptional regulator [Pseudomonadota bacterium]
MMMRTVDKALKLLDYFSPNQPEWGLSELARESAIDKATTLRLLQALRRNGFVEQNPETKRYLLGPTVLRLARTRETVFPVLAATQPVLAHLAEITGETAHASLAQDTALATIAVAEPKRAARVFVDPSQPLPYHATASGIAYLAFAGREQRQRVLNDLIFQTFTDQTIGTREALEQAIEDTRARGYGIGEGSFESDVVGIAAPFFDGTGAPVGAVAVASLSGRLGPDEKARTAAAVLTAAVDVTRKLGAEPDPDFLKLQRAMAA